MRALYVVRFMGSCLVMCSQVFRLASATDSLLLDLRPEAVDAAGAVVGAVEMDVFNRQQYEYRYLESQHRNPMPLLRNSSWHTKALD